MSMVQTAITGFVEYHKINTLFERDLATFVVDETRLKKSVLGTIREWDVTEKIDGTNIRIMLSETGEIQFGGRTDNSQLPADLLMKVFQMFPLDKLKTALWLEGVPTQAILYGEGYGAGIQKGGTYRADKSFILYDVLITTVVYNEACILHGTKSNATQIDLGMEGDFANRVITATGKRDTPKKRQASENTNASIDVKIRPVSGESPQSITPPSREERSSSTPIGAGISEKTSGSASTSTPISLRDRVGCAPSVHANKPEFEKEESACLSSSTTATGEARLEDFSVRPAILQSIKQNLVKAGWTPPRCICARKEWWLDKADIEDVAAKLDIDIVPYLGRMTLDQIVELVRNPFASKIGTAMAEGIVARPIETLFDKRGERIIIKLKTKDFGKGKRAHSSTGEVGSTPQG